MIATFLEPDPFNYFFGSGIGTNLGASIVGLTIGYLWGRRRFKAVHHKLDKHAESHAALHHKLDKLLEDK